MMDETLREKCIKLVDEILSHPISEIFRKPVDPFADEVPGYFERISNPSDLSTVKLKLNNSEYKDLSEFKRDMTLIWENAYTYNGKQSLPGFIADELSAIFSKRMRTIEHSRCDQWVSEFLKARNLICRLFRTIPQRFGSSMSIVENQNEVGSFFKRKLSAEEIKFLEKYRTMLLHADILKGIDKIIFEHETRKMPPVTDITQTFHLLMPKTKRAIRDFILQRAH